jgi:hypothetical protein
MLRLVKLLPYLLITSCFITCLMFSSNAYRTFVMDRQTATIYDVPLHPKAMKITYSSGVLPNRCERISFVTTETPGAVQHFYFDTLLRNEELAKRNWHGNGAFFADANPVRFYRKARGGMQHLEVQTTTNDKWTTVQIDLCKKP